MHPSESRWIYEKRLVQRAQERDDKAFQELVALYERRILYYVHGILGDDSDLLDVMQEFWICIFRKISTLRAPEAFRVWTYTIAHDVAVNQLRRNRRDRTVSTEDIEIPATNTSNWNECDLLDNVEFVHNALSQLSRLHREVLTLRFLEDLTLEEIAEVTHSRVGTVKSRLHYAKAAIRMLLKDDSDGR